MDKTKADIEPDITPVPDRGESVSLMEPLVIGGGAPERTELTDLALDLVRRSSGFHRSIPPPIVASLANLVRAINCYYSNLIEGHDTHPIDIERALKNDYSNDVRKRDLQLEAKAHIAVQEWIDHEGLKGRVVSTEGIREVHRRFCERLPDDLLWVEDSQTKEKMRVIPGELRRHDVTVGRHIPVSPGALTRFLKRFEEIYGNLGKAESIIAAAAAHHRFLWMHPFLDGNGRVARLMSHAMLLESLGTGGVWSVARGLARDAQTYKNHLASCDQARRNDLDGRGTLSQEALVDFTRFFIDTCIDQVTFMETLVQPERLRARILLWAGEEVKLGELPQKATTILEATLYRGELPRAEIVNIVGTGERQARRIVSLLVERGVLTSDSSRAPLRLAFPAALASRWMPGLFPEKPS